MRGRGSGDGDQLERTGDELQRSAVVGQNVPEYLPRDPSRSVDEGTEVWHPLGWAQQLLGGHTLRCRPLTARALGAASSEALGRTVTPDYQNRIAAVWGKDETRMLSRFRGGEGGLATQLIRHLPRQCRHVPPTLHMEPAALQINPLITI